MDYSGSSPKERHDLAIWLQDAFERYAAKLVSQSAPKTPEFADWVRSKICLVGKELSLIIKFGDVGEFDFLPDLQKDLLALKDHHCPPLDFAELITICTSRDPTKAEDSLRPDKDLLAISDHARGIRTLLSKPRLFPVSYLKSLTAEQRKGIEALPEILAPLTTLPMPVPPPLHPWVPAVSHKLARPFLYILLRHYGLHYSAMSRLLRTMRTVREIVGFACAPSVAPQADGKDPLSEGALQQQLYRDIWNENPNYKCLFKGAIKRYLSPEFAEKRKNGLTLLSHYTPLLIIAKKNQ